MAPASQDELLSYIRVIGIPEAKEKEGKAGKVLEEITENFIIWQKI
jgi:hypothetical protein